MHQHGLPGDGLQPCGDLGAVRGHYQRRHVLRPGLQRDYGSGLVHEWLSVCYGRPESWDERSHRRVCHVLRVQGRHIC